MGAGIGAGGVRGGGGPASGGHRRDNLRDGVVALKAGAQSVVEKIDEVDFQKDKDWYAAAAPSELCCLVSGADCCCRGCGLRGLKHYARARVCVCMCMCACARAGRRY